MGDIFVKGAENRMLFVRRPVPILRRLPDRNSTRDRPLTGIRRDGATPPVAQSAKSRKKENYYEAGREEEAILKRYWAPRIPPFYDARGFSAPDTASA